MNLTLLKEKLNVDISDDLLIRILFEMNRFFDKTFIVEIQSAQKRNLRVFNQNERNSLRKYYYYGESFYLNSVNLDSFAVMKYTNDECERVYNDCIGRLDTYGEKKIISSIIERKNNIDNKNLADNSELWLKYYKDKVNKEYDFSFFILRIDQDDFTRNDFDINAYCEIVTNIYDSLENYRHLAIKIDGRLYDKVGVDVTWKLIYKLGVFCENFIQYKDKFSPFKKEMSTNKLAEFIDNAFDTLSGCDIAGEFYSAISTGFRYEDCFVNSLCNKVVLIYKKIKFDNSPVPCPSCMTTIQSGNSFPELFLRSYECKNPCCPDRSKSGRGKRFDEFSVYRYFKLVEDKKSNQIAYELYDKWRRDIFDDKNDLNEMLIKYYSWDNEIIAFYNDSLNDLFDRRIKKYDIKKNNNDYIKKYEELPIFKLFSKINKLLPSNSGNVELNEETIVINGDSSTELLRLKLGQIGAAITSPPYYNAREYSQWGNLLMYLMDMMKNASSVYQALCKNGYYLYNIGDIVNSDNIFVESNMSKHRLQLGFLSCLIFEIIGYNLEGNIIWDKGQVQSKRNSTVNLNSGYVKCINCYEHIFVFKKGVLDSGAQSSYVKHFVPVIKINSKGENTYRHTAPYPPEIIDLLIPYIDPSKYILDPYLGSGTTVKWCKEHGFKSIGYELNKEYFELCLERIFK